MKLVPLALAASLSVPSLPALARAAQLDPAERAALPHLSSRGQGLEQLRAGAPLGTVCDANERDELRRLQQERRELETRRAGDLSVSNNTLLTILLVLLIVIAVIIIV